MKITDITGTIKNGMWSYGPPIPDVKIEEVSRLGDERNESNFSIKVGSISGTYLETGAHILPNKLALIDIPVEKMVTDAYVLGLKDKGPGERVSEGFRRAGKTYRRSDRSASARRRNRRGASADR